MKSGGALTKQDKETNLTAPKARLMAELRRYVDLLVRHYAPQRILLFGSLAAGKVHEYSDIDLIVVAESQRSFWERLVEVNTLLRPQVPVDILIYTPAEWQEVQQRSFFREEVIKKGKVLYDAESGVSPVVSVRRR